MSEIPAEVLERALARWGPQDHLPEILRDEDRDTLDPKRLVWFSKSEIDRGTAWFKTYARTEELGVVDEHRYKGWRKCHTENYWCWYAYDLVDPMKDPLRTEVNRYWRGDEPR